VEQYFVESGTRRGQIEYIVRVDFVKTTDVRDQFGRQAQDVSG